MTKSTELTSIPDTTGRPLDTNILWNEHVNRWTWIGMGAKPIMYTPDRLHIDIYLGAGTRKRRLIIKLNAADLYDIEIGHAHKRSFDWIIDDQVRDVPAENLDLVLRNTYDHLAH